jgi:hypothetical protein
MIDGAFAKLTHHDGLQGPGMTVDITGWQTER